MEERPLSRSATLLIYCPDQKGVVAAVSSFLFQHEANILHADQHQDHDLKLFFMRVEWDLTDFNLSADEFRQHFTPLAERFEMDWSIAHAEHRPAMAVFVSQHLHCLVDLLFRYSIGDLNCYIPFIISNHATARELAEFYKIPFHYIPSPNGKEAAGKVAMERAQAELLAHHGVELIVLARYMQVLSPEFVRQYPQRIINVHHSFLPAFTGARPYHAAHQRGVKLIGATSHYVTEELDEGPIIEQDVARVSHRDQIPDLVRMGRDLECRVLSKAVQWHLESRILHYSGKTVVFD